VSADLPCLGAHTADDLLEGRLPPPRAAAAEAHVADCRDCRVLLAALARSASVAPIAEPAPPQPTPRRGDAVGRYWIQGPLGEGGMGVVYLASDPELGRRVAIKLLRPGGGADARARLLREARAVAQLSHPHVIQVYEVGLWREQVFLAMEYVEGTTLGAHLATPRRWREILALFVAAGRALAAAHAAGIVHRDFKPDNVLVGRDGRVRVSDFGLARTLLGDDGALAASASGAAEAPGEASLTRTGAVLGTPRYMSPEQRAGRVASARSDQYSFCLALTEALAAAAPPRRLVRLLARGLRETPLERHASMLSLLAALEAVARTRRATWLLLAPALLVLLWLRRSPAEVALPVRVAVPVPAPVFVRVPVLWLVPVEAHVRDAPAPRAAPPPPPPPPPPAPDVPPAALAQVVRTRLPALRACYDEARRTAPSLEGTATVSFVVDGDGSVHDVEVGGLGHLYGESCLAQVFRTLRFPAPAGGAAFVARYPLRFTRPSLPEGSAR
jgi:serine/threonine protein kinase